MALPFHERDPNAHKALFQAAGAAADTFTLHGAGDANACLSAAKLFFDGSGPVSGLPEEFAETGGYLEVNTVETASGIRARVIQTFCSPGGGFVFRRDAACSIEDGEETVTWSEWRPFGGSQSVGNGVYTLSENEPEDASRLWVRPSDRTLYFHTGEAWAPIVGVYAETTTP